MLRRPRASAPTSSCACGPACTRHPRPTPSDPCLPSPNPFVEKMWCTSAPASAKRVGAMVGGWCLRSRRLPRVGDAQSGRTPHPQSETATARSRPRPGFQGNPRSAVASGYPLDTLPAPQAVRAASPAPAVEPLGPRGRGQAFAHPTSARTRPHLRNLVDHANTHEKQMRRSISNSPYLLTDFPEHYGRLLFYPEHYGRLLISLCEKFGFFAKHSTPPSAIGTVSGDRRSRGFITRKGVNSDGFCFNARSRRS